MYVYIQSEKSLYTVGFYKPDGEFIPESDHPDSDSAARRVNFLNGGCFSEGILKEIKKMIDKNEKEEKIDELTREEHSEALWGT